MHTLAAHLERSEWDYADLIKRQCAWKDRNGGKNGVADMGGFGIIRKPALYAGHGPSTVELFRRLWGLEAPRVVQRPQGTGQQSSLFD